MISHRKADILNQVVKNRNKQIREQAIRWMNEAARKHHIYEHNFEDMQVDDVTYEGIMHIIYDSEYIHGSRQTLEDPGEPSYYEIELLNTIILPGDIQAEDGGSKIYDMDETKSLCSDIGDMIDEARLREDIAYYQGQQDNNSEPWGGDRDGDDR